METISLTTRQYQMLRWLCSLGPIGDWVYASSRQIKCDMNISKTHTAKLIRILANAGCVEQRKCSNVGHREARVIIPYDDERIAVRTTYIHSEDTIAMLKANAKRKRKLIRYAGWEPHSSCGW